MDVGKRCISAYHPFVQLSRRICWYSRIASLSMRARAVSSPPNVTARGYSTLIVFATANARAIAPRVAAGAASTLDRTPSPPPAAAAVRSGSRRVVCVATVKTDGGSGANVLARTHGPPPPSASAPVDLHPRPPLPLRPGRTKPHTHTRDNPHQRLLAWRF